MLKPLAVLLVALVTLAACGGKSEPPPQAPAGPAPAAPAKKFEVPTDPNNIASIAAGSKDHSTLVAALQAADYVKGVANAGPLTVFAPTNAAFEKLPAGTVENLVKPENVDQLKNILKYHVTTTAYMVPDLKDGQVLGMANGGKVTVHITDGKMTVNDANVIASVRASNGALHIIDAVLLPK
jgi:uncharacterized surface protein with fasciclin (FAS1) repeats